MSLITDGNRTHGADVSVVDVYTRERMTLEAYTRPGQRTHHAGAGAVDWRARLAGECALGQWTEVQFATHAGLGRRLDDRPIHIQPRRPVQKWSVESFRGRLLDDCIDVSWFPTLGDVRSTPASWREDSAASGRTTVCATVRQKTLLFTPVRRVLANCFSGKKQKGAWLRYLHTAKNGRQSSATYTRHR